MHLCAKYINTKFYIFLILEGQATLVGTFEWWQWHFELHNKEQRGDKMWGDAWRCEFTHNF